MLPGQRKMARILTYSLAADCQLPRGYFSMDFDTDLIQIGVQYKKQAIKKPAEPAFLTMMRDLQLASVGRQVSRNTSRVCLHTGIALLPTGRAHFAMLF